MFLFYFLWKANQSSGFPFSPSHPAPRHLLCANCQWFEVGHRADQYAWLLTVVEENVIAQVNLSKAVMEALLEFSSVCAHPSTPSYVSELSCVEPKEAPH